MEENSVDIEQYLPVLRPYLCEIGDAVCSSVIENKGLTFSVEIARQGGKNELSAHIELLLLTINMHRAVNIVKCAPTFKPQCLISMRRLADRLNDAEYRGHWYPEAGHIIRLGDARVIFLSAEEGANVVGNTAHLLLEVDEAQDVDKEKYTKEFRPMAAANNATVVLYGTTWHADTLLEEVKQTNLELERKDGIKRHFRYAWDQVAVYNESYGAFVREEMERLGADHPLFLTQYCLQPPGAGSGLFTREQLAVIHGEHARLAKPEPGRVYVAGVDIAGEGEDGRTSSRDRTVVTIAEVDGGGDKVLGGPLVKVVEHYAWTSEKHTVLLKYLINLLDHKWKCRRIVVDATGMGEPVASFLSHWLKGRVEPFKFTQASKSELGYNLLAAVNGGRVRLYRDEAECAAEMEKAEVQYRPNRTMNFFVDPSRGHDDYLMSLALCLEAAGLYRQRKARGE